MPTYSQSEFLALWRTLRGYAPLCDDAVVNGSDDSDRNLTLKAEMDEWYTRLLLEADASLLEPEDIAGDMLLPPPEDECITLALPPGTLRVLCVSLSGWQAPATVITDPTCAAAQRQGHPFTRACASAPVAIFTSDGMLRLYPASPLDALTSLVCAIRRDGEYTMHRGALASVTRI